MNVHRTIGTIPPDLIRVQIEASDPAVSIWDLAAVQAIVEEAGGRFTDLAGNPGIEGGDALASNGLVHEAALAIIGRPQPS